MSSQWLLGFEKFIKLCSKLSSLTLTKALLAGNQWWPRTSGGRLRFARAITHLLSHRFGNFVKGNKRNPHLKRLINSLSGRQQVNNFPEPPACQHFRWTTAYQTYIINSEISMYKLLFYCLPITKRNKLQPTCK